MPKNDTIIIDFGSGIFKDFDVACEHITKVWGFNDEGWSSVSASKDFTQLAKYLDANGVHAYTV